MRLARVYEFWGWQAILTGTDLSDMTFLLYII